MRACVLVAAIALAGCSAGAFACEDDPQCGADGTCEASGWCSFPDPDCASGRRFGEHAGDGLAGECAPEADGTTGGEMTATTGSGGLTGLDTSVSASSSATTTTGADPTTGALETSDGGTTMQVSTDPTGLETSSTGEAADGLLLWYDFEDPDAPFADASGQGRHGECGDPRSCPTMVAGAVGMAAHFDGTSQWGQLAHDPGLETLDGLSVAVWIAMDTVTAENWQAAVAKPIGADYWNSWEVGVETNADLWGGIHDGTMGAWCTATWPDVDTWHHVAMTWNGAQIELYLDGELTQVTAGTTIAFDDHPLMIGADIDLETLAVFLAGSLDELRVYDHPLSAAEIATLAAR